VISDSFYGILVWFFDMGSLYHPPWENSCGSGTALFLSAFQSAKDILRSYSGKYGGIFV
jgi:hypothetical protein